MQSISEHYDEAAVFSEVSDFSLISYAAECLDAAQATLYLFPDESPRSVLNGSDSPHLLRGISKGFNGSFPNPIPLKDMGVFERIFAQRRSVKAAFLHLYPTLGGRVFTLPNDLEHSRMERLSRRRGGFADTDFEGLRLLATITPTLDGNELSLLQGAWILNKRGFYFRLYLLNSSLFVRSLVRIMGLERCVVSYPPPPNPYPFIAQCDLYLASEHPLERRKLLSFSETDPARLCPRDTDPHLEAAIHFAKPIIAFDTPLLHRRLEWEEDVLLIEDDPAVLADGIEYMCEEL